MDILCSSQSRGYPSRAVYRYELWNTLEGEGSDPSIETVYTPQTAPGLGADPNYIHSQLGVGIDWRKSPGYTRSGGLYYATLHDYSNTNGGTYSFQRLDVDLIQHIPLLRENWVLVGRASGQTTLNDNDLIPYFLLPALGSGSTLRAFQGRSLSRPPQHGDERRDPLDPRERCRHGVLLRRRQSDFPASRLQLQRVEERCGVSAFAFTD